MIYKAFLNRQEITGFPVKGKETSEIWGGNTLLWEKSINNVFKQRGYMMHCGKHAIIINTKGIFKLKPTAPYYEEILERPIESYKTKYCFHVSVSGGKLYVLLINSRTKDNKTKIVLDIGGFYVFTSELDLEKYYKGCEIEIDISDTDLSNSDDYIEPYKTWVENERFHVGLIHYKKKYSSGAYAGYTYTPVWIQNFVFEKGELLESQNKFYTSNSTFFNYGDDQLDSYTVVIPYNGGYSIAFEELSDDTRLVEVNSKTSDMNRIHGKPDTNISTDYYFAGYQNGRFWWYDSIGSGSGIYEFVDNKFVLRCKCNTRPYRGFAPYQSEYLYLDSNKKNVSGTHTWYPCVRKSENSIIDAKKNQMIYETKEPCFRFDPEYGISLEDDGNVYFFYEKPELTADAAIQLGVCVFKAK